MIDIVEKLRRGGFTIQDIDKAADQIESLRYKVATLEDALSECLEWIEADESFACDFPEEWERLTTMSHIAINLTKDGENNDRD